VKAYKYLTVAILFATLVLNACKKSSDEIVEEKQELKEPRVTGYYRDDILLRKFEYNDYKKTSKSQYYTEGGSLGEYYDQLYDTDSVLKTRQHGGSYFEFTSNDAGQVITSLFVPAEGVELDDTYQVKEIYSYTPEGRLSLIKHYNKKDEHKRTTKYTYFANGSLKQKEELTAGFIPKLLSKSEFNIVASKDKIPKFEKLYKSMGHPVPDDLLLWQLSDQMTVKSYLPDGTTVSNERRYEMSDRKYNATTGMLETQQVKIISILPAKAPVIQKYKYQYTDM